MFKDYADEVMELLDKMNGCLLTEDYTEETEKAIADITEAVQFLRQKAMLEGFSLGKSHHAKPAKESSRAVVCVETGTVYESISAASKAMGINTGNISQAVRGLLPTAGGYHWEPYYSDKAYPRAKPKDRKYTKRVKCVETGEIFESIAAAGKAKGVQPNNISAVLRGVNPRAGGYHWELADKTDEQ